MAAGAREGTRGTKGRAIRPAMLKGQKMARWADVTRAAAVIKRQAESLGYDVDLDMANTASTYITCSHSALANDVLIRVSDHEPNEGRYLARVNSRPDVDVRCGDQVYAVKLLAERLGLAADAVPYCKAVFSRWARARAKDDARIVRIAQERAAEEQTRATARALLDDEHKAVFASYASKTGQTRKNFRRSAKYRSACAALLAAVELLKRA